MNYEDIDRSKMQHVDCRGVRCWAKGDREHPTGNIRFPRIYFAEKTPEIAEAIRRINRKTPKVGDYIDPWFSEQRRTLRLGCVVDQIEIVDGKETVRSTDFFVHTRPDMDGEFYFARWNGETNEYRLIA